MDGKMSLFFSEESSKNQGKASFSPLSLQSSDSLGAENCSNP